MDSLSFSQIQGHFDEPPAPNNAQYFEAQPWKGPPSEAATHSFGDHVGESPEHQAFKEAVRLHPAWFDLLQRPRVLGQWFDGIRIYAAAPVALRAPSAAAEL